MLEEIYGAIEDGFNVDFGLGRTELTVGGRFKTEFEKFDRERHAIRINLRPSPRLNQLADWFPAEVIQFFPNAPLPNEVSIHNDRYLNQEGREFCVIPAGYTLPLFIHGKRLKVMGDHPDVGIVIRQEEGEKKVFHRTSHGLHQRISQPCLSAARAADTGQVGGGGVEPVQCQLSPL